MVAGIKNRSKMDNQLIEPILLKQFRLIQFSLQLVYKNDCFKMGSELVFLLILVCTLVTWSAGKYPHTVFDADFDQPTEDFDQLMDNAYTENKNKDAIELNHVLGLQSRSTGRSHKKSLDTFHPYKVSQLNHFVNHFVIRSRFWLQFQEWSSARWNLRAHWRNKQ